MATELDPRDPGLQSYMVIGATEQAMQLNKLWSSRRAEDAYVTIQLAALQFAESHEKANLAEHAILPCAYEDILSLVALEASSSFVEASEADQACASQPQNLPPLLTFALFERYYYNIVPSVWPAHFCHCCPTSKAHLYESSLLSCRAIC